MAAEEEITHENMRTEVLNEAAEEELRHENVRRKVLNEVALRHPIVFDRFSIYVTCMVQVSCGS